MKNKAHLAHLAHLAQDWLKKEYPEENLNNLNFSKEDMEEAFLAGVTAGSKVQRKCLCESKHVNDRAFDLLILSEC